MYTYGTRKNIRQIQPTEYTSLITPIRQNGLNQHAWVTIKGGLYHGDVGQIRALRDDGEYVDIAVVPRIAPANRHHSTKRRKKQDGRPHPRRIRISDAVEEYGEEQVKIAGKGFEMFGKYYEKHGFTIVTLSHKEVDITRPTMHRIANFIDAALESLINPYYDDDDETGTHDETKQRFFCDDDIWQAGHIDINEVEVDSLLRIGDDVEMIEGDKRGMRGVVSKPPSNGEVTLSIQDKDKEGLSRTVEYTEREEYVRAVFERGHTVTIRIGIFAGQSGIVEEVEPDGKILVRENHTLREVRHH